MLGATVIALFLTAGVGVAQSVGALPPQDPTGKWLVAKQIARIRIVDCNEHLWGVVSWETRAGTDHNNPDVRLRERPTLGMPILLGMARTKPNQWDGQIYNSEDGRTYSANISLSDPNTLKVQGCVLGILCGGENWTRVAPSDTDSGPPKPPPPSNSRKSANNRPPPNSRKQDNPAGTPGDNPYQSAYDVCLGLFGTPGLAH